MKYSPEFSRVRRVGEQIRRELADIFRREIDDQSLGLLTISGVDVSPDLKYARIYITVLDNNKDVKEAVQYLNNIAGRLRYHLSQRLSTRTTPLLQFVHDSSIEEGNRLSALIDSVQTSEKRDDYG